MSEQILFYIAFFSQIVLISFYLPGKIIGRMEFILKHYPPSTYPKLYPNPIEYYELKQKSYRIANTLILVLGVVALALLATNEHESDLGNAIALGYFMIQFMPMLFLEFSLRGELKLMRALNSRSTRSAEMTRRRVVDYVSPRLFAIVAVVYAGFVAVIFYVRQFDYAWFGGYTNIAAITAMNLFFAAILGWHIYGKKLNPHQTQEDRARQTKTVATILAIISIAATLFVTIAITLGALELREYMPVAQSMYFQLIALVSFRSFRIEGTNFEVYKEDPLIT